MNKAGSFAVLLGGLLLMIFSATAPSAGPSLFGPANVTGLELGGFMAFVVGFLGLARGSST